MESGIDSGSVLHVLFAIFEEPLQGAMFPAPPFAGWTGSGVHRYDSYADSICWGEPPMKTAPLSFLHVGRDTSGENMDSTGNNSCAEDTGPIRTGAHGETCLIAEDEALVSFSMKKILEDAGYKVLLASDGVEALAIFRERPEDISVILSDVVMPKMSGIEFLEEARRVRPDIKVIFVSGYSASFLRERGVLREGMELITKPFAKQELLRRVREALDRQ